MPHAYRTAGVILMQDKSQRNVQVLIVGDCVRFQAASYDAVDIPFDEWDRLVRFARRERRRIAAGKQSQ